MGLERTGRRALLGTWLAAEPGLAADAQAPLDGPILLAVAHRRPDEQNADDYERSRK
jgi:hypothetical protein